jgi:hypothetical protein
MLVSNPRDKIDAWLQSEVEPLAPPPGTFERISQRARRRKRNQVIMSAAGAAVVVAAVVAVPRVASTLLPGSSRPAGQPIAAGTSHRSAPVSVAPSPRKGGGTTSSRSATAVPGSGSPLLPTASGRLPPVPKHFRPTSITEIGHGVGAVIGLAGVAGHCANPDHCTSIAGTRDYGKSWYGVGAPVVGAPAGSTGVSQLRYLTSQYGWAFNPALYATADGGATWTAQNTAGLRVTDLETAGNRAFALFARCGASASQYATDCTSFSLYSSAAGSGTWQPVPVPRGYRIMTGSAGQAAAASLVLASGTAANPEAGAGYVLTPTGELLGGPLVAGPWQAIGPIPAACRVGSAQASGQPAGVQFASGAAAAPQLVLSCDGPASAAGTQSKTIFTSGNGVSWQQAGAAPTGGTATSLAAASGGLVILATTAGIDYSPDGGGSWQPASFSGGQAPAGGFTYVGMTTSAQGVAVPADSSLGEVFVTADGGRTWQVSPISAG